MDDFDAAEVPKASAEGSPDRDPTDAEIKGCKVIHDEFAADSPRGKLAPDPKDFTCH